MVFGSHVCQIIQVLICVFLHVYYNLQNNIKEFLCDEFYKNQNQISWEIKSLDNKKYINLSEKLNAKKY